MDENGTLLKHAVAIEEKYFACALLVHSLRRMQNERETSRRGEEFVDGFAIEGKGGRPAKLSHDTDGKRGRIQLGRNRVVMANRRHAADQIPEHTPPAP